MTRRAAAVGGHAGLLLALLGVVALATGRPFVFPSLGPSAYLLAVDGEDLTARRVVGGHAVGAVAGLLSYRLLAAGLVVTGTLPALAVPTARLAASGALSVALTAGGMVATDTRHAPAAATTLIVSLGLLSRPVDAGVVVVAVAVLFAADRALARAADGSR